MNQEQLRAIWRKEEQAAHIHGWDFSHIRGRYEEEACRPIIFMMWGPSPGLPASLSGSSPVFPWINTLRVCWIWRECFIGMEKLRGLSIGI